MGINGRSIRLYLCRLLSSHRLQLFGKKCRCHLVPDVVEYKARGSATLRLAIIRGRAQGERAQSMAISSESCRSCAYYRVSCLTTRSQTDPSIHSQSIPQFGRAFGDTEEFDRNVHYFRGHAPNDTKGGPNGP